MPIPGFKNFAECVKKFERKAGIRSAGGLCRSLEMKAVGSSKRQGNPRRKK